MIVKRNKEPFKMFIEDIVGTVITGKIVSGEVKIGDKVQIADSSFSTEATVISLELFRKVLDVAKKGQNVAIKLEGVDRKNLKKGMIICDPNSLKPEEIEREVQEFRTEYKIK